MNLLEQQASNRRRTWAVMLVFTAFLVLLGLGFDQFFLGYRGISFPIGAVFALALGSGSALFSYYGGDRVVLFSTHAQPLKDLLANAGNGDTQLKLTQLNDVVDEMAIAAGLPKPAVYVVPDPDPNAFATGRDPAHASLAVTQGLLDRMDREELQGVVAHEMSHIRNYDTRLMMIIAALVGAVVLLSDWGTMGLWFGGGDSDDQQGGGAGGAVMFALWIIGIILAPLIGQLLAMMVSRQREYLADASGAELTRNPLGLARALQEIDSAEQPDRVINRGTAHLCIADPVGHPLGEQEHTAADLFATHPPIAQRVARLRQMAYQLQGGH